MLILKTPPMVPFLQSKSNHPVVNPSRKPGRILSPSLGLLRGDDPAKHSPKV